MDRMRAKGLGQKMAGKAKQAAGKLTGDAKLQAEGQADEAAGGIKNVLGGMKDAVKDADRRTRR